MRRATFKNATTLSLSGADGQRDLSFAHAILATGSRPAIPASLKLDDPRVMDSTGALELPDVPARLLVIGGGYIGLEMGTVYQALGSEVTVVEALPHLLNGADPDLVRPLQLRMQRRFKAIRLNTKVEKLEARKDGIAVTCTGPDGSTTDVFDRVLVAVGRKPNTEQLGLEQTKIALSPQGFVQVDRQMRTAEPTIFAIGDVVGEPMLAHKASHEGLVAARVIAGQQAAFDATIPAVIFTDPEIAWCGLTEEAAKASGQARDGRAISLGGVRARHDVGTQRRPDEIGAGCGIRPRARCRHLRSRRGRTDRRRRAGSRNGRGGRRRGRVDPPASDLERDGHGSGRNISWTGHPSLPRPRRRSGNAVRAFRLLDLTLPSPDRKSCAGRSLARRTG